MSGCNFDSKMQVGTKKCVFFLKKALKELLEIFQLNLSQKWGYVCGNNAAYCCVFVDCLKSNVTGNDSNKTVPVPERNC